MTAWVGGAAAASPPLAVPVPGEQRARFGAGLSGLRGSGATAASLLCSRSGGGPLLTYRPLYGPTGQYRCFTHRYLRGVRGNPIRPEQLPVLACRIGCPSRGGACPASDWLRSPASWWNATGRPGCRPDLCRSGPSASVCVVSGGPGRDGAGTWWPRASSLLASGSERRSSSFSSSSALNSTHYRRQLG
ncbi:hypothetical protein NN561_014820 [Cricetulus griseus]